MFQFPSCSDLLGTMRPALLSLAQIPGPAVYLTCGSGQVTWALSLSVRVHMGEKSMTQLSVSRSNEPCMGARLCSLGSDPRQRLGGGEG